MTPAELVEFVGRVPMMRTSSAAFPAYADALSAFEAVVGMLDGDHVTGGERVIHNKETCEVCVLLAACRRAGTTGGEQ